MRIDVRIEYSRRTRLAHWSDRGVTMANDQVGLSQDHTIPAGNNTRKTATDWNAWASSARTAFSNAIIDVMDVTIIRAVTDYGSNLYPTMTGVAHDVDAMGRNTVAATHTMMNADAHSTGILNPLAADADAQRRILSRRINPQES
jgi:hypothetical protein